MRKGISYTFFVTEAEYPKLQAACPGEFPYDYVQFSARVNQAVREAAATVAIERVYVSVDQFLAWCAREGVQPNNLSRARYAALIGFPPGTHTGDL
jgi:hypothetical protein